MIERLNREIRRRTRVVGTFPDGNSALMLVCARLRHVASKAWGTKRYMNINHLYDMQKEESNQVVARLVSEQLHSNLRKIWTVPRTLLNF